MAKRAVSLGKGLDALLPSSFSIEPPDTPKYDDGTSVGIIAMIDVKLVRPNPMQPRQDFDREALEDLKKSIREKGVIQPITVRRMDGGYEIIAGERRVRASLEVGLDMIPAYILDVETDADMLELALIENVQRENLNPIEVALGYKRLMEECHLTQEEVSRKVGKDRTTITNFLRLLRLPVPIQESLRAKTLSMGHARALLAISDEEKQLRVFEYVRAHELSVRRTEEIVKKIESGMRVEDALAEKASRNAVQIKNLRGGIEGQQQPPESITRISTPVRGLPLPAVSTEGFTIPDDLREEFLPAERASVSDTPREQQKIHATEFGTKDPHVEQIESKLRHILATQVRIKMRSGTGSGSIEIEFYSADELERLLELFDIIERDQHCSSI
ncbi:MAG: ParB/RepB/Spo0J family partition protein [Bacteroidota bacterium]|nr:ParB/RepB/Spo0J family partition protein [Candidatus Kapabacteria bacterium]MDW8220218.1 ParB/RepB/Spo0J family partition protein [Bacteroidota bacterium]